MTPEQLLLIIASEFESVDVSGAIAVAELQIGPKVCGSKRPLLVAYLAAHLLSVGRRKFGASGDVQSLTEDKLSLTYSNSSAKINNSLARTIYGQEYDRIIRSCIFTPMTTLSWSGFHGCC